MNRTHRRDYRALGIIGLLLSLTVLSACDSGGPAGTAPTPTPLPTPVAVQKPTYTVQKGTVTKTLEFTGRVSPVTEQELFFKRNGHVSAIFVSRGDQVKTGDTLAELELGDLENQLEQAQVTLQTAETTLSKAETEVADQLADSEIALESARIRLEQAEARNADAAVNGAYLRLTQVQANLDLAQEAYDQAWEPARDWELYMTKPTGDPLMPGPSLSEQLENERDFTERNLALAQSNLGIAQAEYAQALSNRESYSYDLQLLAQEVRLAELRIERLSRGVDPLLALNVEQARLAIANLERQMEDARLTAPFDGQVLSLNIQSGSPAEAFKTALILGDPTDLEITANLSPEELTEMSAGQPAVVRLRARPEEDLNGSVRQLPYPYGGGAAGDTTADADKSTRIALEESDIDLELGELATVIIVLEQRDDALWLPPAAVRTFQGRTFVVIQEGDRQIRVDVVLGIESEERVEIKSGVKEGDTILGQ
jgi:multidrug efflux pump subunit AcrA (membrane-fusion protein)